MKETIDAILNPLPTLTWNWLKMNRANVSLESQTEGSAKVTMGKLPKGVSYTDDGEKEILSVQEIDTALGKGFSSILHEHAVIPSVITVSPGVKDAVLPVHFDLKDSGANYKGIVVKAGDESDFTLILDFTSARDSGGVNAVQTKIYAGKNARVHLITVQLLGRNFIHFNDVGCVAGEGSLVDVTQVELGSSKIFTGVYSTLESEGSSFKNDVAYYLGESQELDMNFVSLQTGRRTQSLMNVYGTLGGNAKKTYRGTIDFKKGCVGSTGNEQEEVLLLSPTVVNKSIPLILCDEEDVSGEHGASIGRLDEDILFYMKSRGLTQKDAETLMARAKVQRVCSLIKDEATEKKVGDFMDLIFE